jgi:hypothetical protein
MSVFGRVTPGTRRLDVPYETFARWFRPMRDDDRFLELPGTTNEVVWRGPFGPVRLRIETPASRFRRFMYARKDEPA